MHQTWNLKPGESRGLGLKLKQTAKHGTQCFPPHYTPNQAPNTLFTLQTPV